MFVGTVTFPCCVFTSNRRCGCRAALVVMVTAVSGRHRDAPGLILTLLTKPPGLPTYLNLVGSNPLLSGAKADILVHLLPCDVQINSRPASHSSVFSPTTHVFGRKWIYSAWAPFLKILFTQRDRGHQVWTRRRSVNESK